MYRTCTPDWRWLDIVRARAEHTPPTDALSLRVYNVMNGVEKDGDIYEALGQYSVPYKRDALVTFFLSKATFQQIAIGTWVELPVLAIFEQLFIDPDQFKDKMDLRLYARFYRDNICEEQSRPLVDRAIDDGPYSLLNYWATGNELVRIPDEEIATKLVMMAWSKVNVASQESIMSGAAKQGLSWSKLVKDVLTARNRLNPTPLDPEDLLLGIKDREVTAPIGFEGIGFSIDDVVH